MRERNTLYSSVFSASLLLYVFATVRVAPHGAACCLRHRTASACERWAAGRLGLRPRQRQQRPSAPPLASCCCMLHELSATRACSYFMQVGNSTYLHVDSWVFWRHNSSITRWRGGGIVRTHQGCQVYALALQGSERSGRLPSGRAGLHSAGRSPWSPPAIHSRGVRAPASYLIDWALDTSIACRDSCLDLDRRSGIARLRHRPRRAAAAMEASVPGVANPSADLPPSQMGAEPAPSEPAAEPAADDASLAEQLAASLARCYQHARSSLQGSGAGAMSAELTCQQLDSLASSFSSCIAQRLQRRQRAASAPAGGAAIIDAAVMADDPAAGELRLPAVKSIGCSAPARPGCGIPAAASIITEQHHRRKAATDALVQAARWTSAAEERTPRRRTAALPATPLAAPQPQLRAMAAAGEHMRGSSRRPRLPSSWRQGWLPWHAGCS